MEGLQVETSLFEGQRYRSTRKVHLPRRRNVERFCYFKIHGRIRGLLALTNLYDTIIFTISNCVTLCVKEKRRKGTETVKKNKNPARVGASGYRGKEAQWENEVDSGATIKGHHISSKRARHYIFARRKRDSSGAYIISPQTEPIADEIVR